MAKRQDLKRKLKAADRRRRRRGDTQSSRPTSVAEPAGPDVCGLITRAILDFAETSGEPVRDRSVVAALRCCLQATTPAGEPSQILHQRLIAISERSDVDRQPYRQAVKDLMELAKGHQDPAEPASFLRYLAVLAG